MPLIGTFGAGSKGGFGRGGGLGSPYGASFLVVAGGGGGSTQQGPEATASGGGGGFRSSWNSEISGGGAPAESQITLVAGETYTVTIGGGGTGGSPGPSPTAGSGSPSSIIGEGVSLTSI